MERQGKETVRPPGLPTGNTHGEKNKSQAKKASDGACGAELARHQQEARSSAAPRRVQVTTLSSLLSGLCGCRFCVECELTFPPLKTPPESDNVVPNGASFSPAPPEPSLFLADFRLSTHYRM